MALYVILATLTEAGAKDIGGIMKRRTESIRELERSGIKTVADYADYIKNSARDRRPPRARVDFRRVGAR